MTTASTLKLRLIASDPPFEPAHGVLFGMQLGKEVEDPVPAVTTTTFNIEIGIVFADGVLDFRGPYVHGRKGDRFLYLSWGLPDPSELFEMFARAKIKLADIPKGVLDLATRPSNGLVGQLEATNSVGQPSTGTIRAPSIAWSVEPLGAD